MNLPANYQTAEWRALTLLREAYDNYLYHLTEAHCLAERISRDPGWSRTDYAMRQWHTDHAHADRRSACLMAYVVTGTYPRTLPR